MLVMAILPVAARLDLKQLAAVAGSNKAEMADPAVAERATGYIVGGISPLGGKKRMPTILDESALGHDIIFVSAGQRGSPMELVAQGLVRLTGATATTVAVP